MMKTCNVCKKEMEESLFYRNSTQKGGLDCKCKACTKEYQRSERGLELNRKSVGRYQKGSPQKTRARSLLKNAVRAGKVIKRNLCEMCYDSPTHCHHDDYSKPLDIIELCVGCHSRLHFEN